MLSYYLSSQEVDQGCRGSVNVTSCDIAGKINSDVIVVFPIMICLQLITRIRRGLMSPFQESGTSIFA